MGASATIFSLVSNLLGCALIAQAAVAIVAPPPVFAAQGDCSQPVTSGASPTAGDCLFILQTSVGAKTCDPECICDTTGDAAVTASDALLCLGKAVGQDVELNCQCPSTTTTVTTTTTTTPGPPSASVTAAVEGDAAPDGTLTATADIVLAGGCTVESIAWTQTAGAPATIDTPDAAQTTVGLADAVGFKDELFAVLAEPPITADQLPPNVPLPEGEFPAGLQSRFQIVGVNPFALEEAGLVTLLVTVDTTCGTVTASVDAHAALPWRVTSVIHNVPVGIPVLLHGKDHVDENNDGFDDDTNAPVGVYDWALASVPAGSTATLIDAATQNPDFTPDVAGTYSVTVTNTAEPPGTQIVTLTIYAGTWHGVITGQDADGLPLAAQCTGCHDGSPAPDKFTPWRQTGHAEIFKQNLNTNTHYGEQCFGCHTIGFDKNALNGGVDEAVDYPDFIAAGLFTNPPGDDWSQVLSDFPATAKLANVQCESCHGPQDGSDAHMLGGPRVSLSADVCATCHGEPARHGRFQQWQLSKHADYDLAVEEGLNGSCARCHTVNGFLTWLPILLDDDPATDPLANIAVTWTADEIHPQTCATCHDPHAEGNLSGEPSNATVRITGNTPPLIAGFQAFGVGRGAICMTCHNTRRGLHNDDTFDTIRGTSEAVRASHGGPQADVLMGENAFLVNVGIRGSHSFVQDTCANCHLERTPPPPDLSYDLTGTNHTFFASDQICSDCHGSAFNAQGVKQAFNANIDELKVSIEDAILALMADQIAAGNVIVVNLGDAGERTISDIAEVTGVELGEAEGRQAVTLTFSDQTTAELIALNNFQVRDAAVPANCTQGLPRCELFDFADDRLVKAGWNYSLVHQDKSSGIHNPSFVLEVLDASIDGLRDVAAGL